MEAILKREVVLSKTLARLLGVLAFIIFTALGAFVRIPLPFTPVPITLQTLFVLLSGVFLGAGLGATAQVSYLFLGLLGLPIFTGAGFGLIYLFGPTGGYLIGFILASFLAGRLISLRRESLFSVFCILCLADFILLGSGVIWLAFISGYSFHKSLFIGFMPFIIGDLLKAMVASILYLKLKTRIREVF